MSNTAPTFEFIDKPSILAQRRKHIISRFLQIPVKSFLPLVSAGTFNILSMPLPAIQLAVETIKASPLGAIFFSGNDIELAVLLALAPHLLVADALVSACANSEAEAHRADKNVSISTPKIWNRASASIANENGPKNLEEYVDLLKAEATVVGLWKYSSLF